MDMVYDICNDLLPVAVFLFPDKFEYMDELPVAVL